MIDSTVYSTATLLGVMTDLEEPSNYWLNLCFSGRELHFDTEWVEFEKLTNQRKLAPLVVPLAQGKPIYDKGSRLTRVKPAYVKPKDSVSITRLVKRTPGNLGGSAPMTIQERYDAIVKDIAKDHIDAIERRWEWMAAQAVLDGQVILEDDAYPRDLVDFERDAGHTITLGVGVRWGDAGVSILSNVEEWRTTMRNAYFGGIANRMTIGSDVWAVLREDTEIRDLLKTDFRPSNNGLALNLGLREGLEVEFVGRLSGTIDVYVYSDYYQIDAGTVVPFMDPRDVVLTGPNVMGVRCFGAILDKKAGFQPLSIFPSMWEQDDPSVTFLMHQSAPLMVPVNPNATLRARVLA